MKFDIVIGNPPYNNDIYLDFVELGHKLADKYSCWVTPAKWQAKRGRKNESFRNDIVPYMSKIVYYPDTLEVFDTVDSQGGISYFIIGKDVQKLKEVKTICSVQKLFESDGFETCTIDKVLYNKQIRSIVNKLGNYTPLKSMNINSTVYGWYHIGITNIYSEKNCTNKKGSAYVLISPYIQRDTIKYNADTTFIAAFPYEEQAKSYVSYINTKFIRFMFLMAKCTLHMQGENAWRFIPDPGAFDHIFTDQELYQKYNLTDEEINIIESVIRERNS